MLTDGWTDGRTEWGIAIALSQIGWLGAKKTYYMDRIANCGKNQKQLYQILNSLLKRSCEQDLPDHTSEGQLVDKFNTFFCG